MLLKQKQNMFKEVNNCFTYRKMQLLKSEMFKKIIYVNIFTVSNVHIFLNEKKKKLDNK